MMHKKSEYKGRRVIDAVVIAYTESGGRIAEQVREVFEGAEDLSVNLSTYIYREDFSDGRKLMNEIMQGKNGRGSADVIVFISAAGIAVRMIAPFIKSKVTDPAVIVMDDGGRFAIPLLSGHIGGANEIAEIIAQGTGAAPVITTASDSRTAGGRVSSLIYDNELYEKSYEERLEYKDRRDLFYTIFRNQPIDVWAKKNGYSIGSMQAAKRVAAGILAGNIPEISINDKSGDILIFFHDNKTREGRNTGFNETALVLTPKKYVIGIGCKKGTKFKEMEDFVRRILDEKGISEDEIFRICSADIKSNEAAIKRLAEKLNVEFRVFSAQVLNSLPGEFSGSEFVKSVAGTDNVCERSAVAGCGAGGTIFIKKTAENGMTMAAAIRTDIFKINES
ncbi:MAG: hypothetical protein HFE90_02870 [Firmicutes bacterium]|nr:hypothetical protein [Bacillota bacterium]